MSGWLTVEEAANRVGRSPRTIYQWVADRLLEGYELERDGRIVTGVMEGKLLEVDRDQRKRRGRPRKMIEGKTS